MVKRFWFSFRDDMLPWKRYGDALGGGGVTCCKRRICRRVGAAAVMEGRGAMSEDKETRK